MAKVLGPGQPATHDEPETELEEEQNVVPGEGDTPEEEETEIQESEEGALTDEEDGAEETFEDDEGHDDGAVEQQAAARKGKKSASEVIREQKAELKRLREEREKGARERIADQARLDERTRINNQQNQAVNEQREREMLEAMDPVERVRYESKKSENRILAELNRTRMEAADAKDHAAFQAKISSDPDLGAYADEVEQTLQKVRSTGGNTDRVTTLAYLIGRDALANKGAKKTSARAAADRRVRQVSSKAPSGRASEGATRGKGKTAEDRLAGVII